MNSRQSRLADSDYIGLVIQIYITMQRVNDGFLIENEIISRDDSDEYRLIMKICSDLEKRFSVRFNEGDLDFLTTILKGSKLQEAVNIPYDSVVLGQMIKNVIQYVSSQLHIDLTNDFSLYQGLLAHMEPSLFRLKQGLKLFNPLTEEIKRKYPVLF